MSILPILQYPDARLKLVAEPVVVFDQELHSLVSGMFETMYAQNGVGLAATQVNRQLRLFVMDVGENERQPIVMINPVIVRSEGEMTNEEGCLSFPGIYAKVKRFAEIEVEYFDKDGIKSSISCTDISAICVQHEIDHLDGVTFFDHLSILKQNMLRKKLQKLRNRVEG